MSEIKEEILLGALVLGDKKTPTSFELDFNDFQDLKKIIIREETEVEIFAKNINSLDLILELKGSSKLVFKSLIKEEIKGININGILMKNAEVNFYIADFSNGVSSSNISFNLLGNNSSCFYRMASISKGKDNKTFNVSIDHTGLETTGLVDNYGVSKDESKLSFLGTSFVKNGAKKTKTRQSANILVFDKNSTGLCKPILKIDENDIEASHGASLGKPNEEQMFYLMSRGLTEAEAKKLIITGYLNPILVNFKNNGIEEDMNDVFGGSK